MKTLRKLFLVLSLVGASLTFTACGGGNGAVDASPSTKQISKSQNYITITGGIVRGYWHLEGNNCKNPADIDPELSGDGTIPIPNWMVAEECENYTLTMSTGDNKTGIVTYSGTVVAGDEIGNAELAQYADSNLILGTMKQLLLTASLAKNPEIDFFALRGFIIDSEKAERFLAESGNRNIRETSYDLLVSMLIDAKINPVDESLLREAAEAIVNGKCVIDVVVTDSHTDLNPGWMTNSWGSWDGDVTVTPGGNTSDIGTNPDNTTSGDNNLVIGDNNLVVGDDNVVIGDDNVVIGDGEVVTNDEYVGEGHLHEDDTPPLNLGFDDIQSTENTDNNEFTNP